MSTTIAVHKSSPRLNSPIAGMARLTLRKFRQPLLWLAFGWPCLIALDRLRHGGVLDLYSFVLVLGLPGMLLFLPLALFSDLEPNLLAKPVSTRALAGWHMLCGGASVALIWILNATCLWIPLGFPVAVWWPAAALAGIMCCALAIRWLPAGLAYLHAFLFLLPPAAIGMAFHIASEQGVAPSILAACGIALCVVMYPAGVAALSRTRRGDAFDFSRMRPRLRPEAPPRLLAPFRGALAAQVWFEFRGHGLLLPVTVTSLGVVTLCVLFFDVTEPVTLIQLLSGGKLSVAANIWANALPAVSLMACLYLASMIGAEAGMRKPDRTLNGFFATRPVGSGDLVAAKMISAALSTLAAGVLQIPLWAVWLLLPAHGNRTSGPLGGYLLACLTRYLDAGDFAVLLAAGAILFLLIWKLRIDTLFVHLTGRGWIGWVILAVCVGPVLIVSLGLDVHHGASLRRAVMDDLPFWMPIAAAVKLIGVAFTVQLLLRFQQTSVQTLCGITALWLITALALIAVFAWALAPMRISPWTIAAVIVLIMPGARAALAPLALVWDRHR